MFFDEVDRSRLAGEMAITENRPEIAQSTCEYFTPSRCSFPDASLSPRSTFATVKES